MSLPKVIKQDTYDEVVLENVVDFDKPIEEAIEETIQEFEAQGVLLSNIIKKVALGPNNDTIVHPILDALKLIQKAAGSEDTDEANSPTDPPLSETLTKFTQECKVSLAHRVMASKNGAYSFLIKIIDMSKHNEEVLLPAVEAVQAVTEGNPDILDLAGMSLMKELMTTYATNVTSDVMEFLARWCYHSNFKHEKNRATLFDALLPHYLVISLSNCTAMTHKARILATLCAIRSFTYDDDIRTEFGKAHENCRMLVEEENLIPMCLEIIRDAVSCNSASVAGDAMAVLSSASVRAEYCRLACDSGALEVIARLLETFPESAQLCKQSLTLLTTLAGDDRVKVQVIKAGTHHLVPRAMDKHQLHVGVCISGCSCVSMLTLRHPKHAAELVKCGAAGQVLQAMKQHPKEKQLQKLGCLAVRNLCSRSPETAALLRDIEADSLIQTALDTHGDALRDMATGALRDLGVEVTLVEQWHGKGHELEQGD